MDMARKKPPEKKRERCDQDCPHLSGYPWPGDCWMCHCCKHHKDLGWFAEQCDECEAEKKEGADETAQMADRA
jgi:hypothetical protein